MPQADASAIFRSAAPLTGHDWLRLAGLGVNADDRATTTVDVTEQIALVFIRRRHLHLHDGFEQDGTRFLDGVLQGKDPGHLESQFVGVDFVERAATTWTLMSMT